MHTFFAQKALYTKKITIIIIKFKFYLFVRWVGVGTGCEGGRKRRSECNEVGFDKRFVFIHGFIIFIIMS